MTDQKTTASMGMPRAQRRLAETYQSTLPANDLVSLCLDFLVCAFTAFVTSKNLAIESRNRAHRMAQSYKTSEKGTTLYYPSNKR